MNNKLNKKYVVILYVIILAIIVLAGVYIKQYVNRNVEDKATYEYIDIEHLAPSVRNNVQDLGIVANNILNNYFYEYYNNDEKHKLSNVIPLKDKFIAGDINEFVEEIDYELKFEESNVISTVQIRVKREEEKKYGNDDRIFTKYKLVSIGEKVDTEGLKLYDDVDFEIKSY